jgi:nucleotide-binding universal stress UspA family protein
MFKKILVASDLTDASRRAVATALDLARAVGGHVTVLHVLEIPYESRQWFLPGNAEVQALRAALATQEEAARAKLTEQVAAGAADVVVAHGIPVDEIVAQATRLGVDLIVMGTHGRRGLQHAVMGSVAERVVRTATVPVMTIRGEQ